MREHIDSYLEAHESAWALTTMKSETSRLRAAAHFIDQGPEAVVAGMSHLKPYALKTLMIRLVHMEGWIRKTQSNVTPAFADYMAKHKNKFKHVYQKEEINVRHEDIIQRASLAGISGESLQTIDSLLRSGLRISEFYRVTNGSVIGKGGKTRKVFGGSPSKPNCSQTSLRRALRKIGLKPHTLRKLAATRAAERGASAADLCKIFGWSDIKTAYQYLQPKDDARLEELMK